MRLVRDGRARHVASAASVYYGGGGDAGGGGSLPPPPVNERGWGAHLVDAGGRALLDVVNNVCAVGRA